LLKRPVCPASLKRIIKVARFVYGVLHSILLTFLQDWPTLFGVPAERLLVGTLLVVAVVLPLGLWNWRCPNCRRNLGRSLSIKQCPHCGIVLRG
jgi:hypothetical protein